MAGHKAKTILNPSADAGLLSSISLSFYARSRSGDRERHERYLDVITPLRPQACRVHPGGERKRGVMEGG
jgi:hypothetical protein